MTHKVDVETVDPLRRRIAVEIPAEEVSAEIEKSYEQLGRAAKVRGFRPGRVPRAVLERLFGDRVRADVFERLIQESYTEALAEQHIAAVGHPEIVTEQAQPGVALRYSATVEIKPEVVAEHYAGLEAQRPTVTVTDAEVGAFIEQLRQSLAQLRPVTDRSRAERGDVVTIDYEARLDNKLIGRGDNREIEIGANGFPPEFDAHLTGAEIGSAIDFSATYPPEHGAPDLAGKTVQFHIVVRALSQKDVPPLDDEFAKDHGECATLQELQERVRAQLEADATRRADEAMRRGLMDALANAHDIPVPRALVERRTEALVHEVWREWQQQRIQPKTEAEAKARLRQELEPRAYHQVKIALLLEAIARQERISVSEQEIDDRIAAIAAQAGAAAERVRALYRDPEARRELETRMLHARAIDVVAAQARISDVESPVHVAEPAESR